VRIDERSAGFLALGLAKLHRHPVAVTTTSGTAAVNLHPAVVEADYAGVPVIVLTADRPVEMRGTGANQTIDQTNLYGGSVRHFAELSVDTAPTETEQRAMVRDAVAIARGEPGSVRRADFPYGPVHLNVGLREPLIPDISGTYHPAAADAPLDEGASAGVSPWRPVGAERTAATGSHESRSTHLEGVDEAELDRPGVLTRDDRRTVVVAGDGAGPVAERIARGAGWPLLAEPSSGARFGTHAMAAYRLYLDTFHDDVERVLVFGRPTLSRPVASLLARVGGERVQTIPYDWGHWDEPLDSGDRWLTRWKQADTAALRAIAAVLDDEGLCGPAVASAVAGTVPDGGLLVAGSSSAIRDLDLAPVWDFPPELGVRRLLANRGASGIDGTVSTAVGAALAHARPLPHLPEPAQPAYALMGDLTFLHDSNGLVLGPDEPRPDLTIVVVNDDGGGLFSLLEQGEPERAGTFERVFGTPHHVDISALCAATSTPYVRATTIDELRNELAQRTEGIRVVEVRVDRSRTRGLHARLKAAVLDAIAQLAR
jgi:2-succinyl-5-enolpyruvyl-6-hydroxy-3-cyclohexene-1-carboxylate synthase